LSRYVLSNFFSSSYPLVVVVVLSSSPPSSPSALPFFGTPTFVADNICTAMGFSRVTKRGFSSIAV